MLFKPLLVIVLSVSGVLSQWGWRVTYTPERICALNGSSVDMSCSYSYPTSHTVQKTFWFIHWNKSQEPNDLSQDSEYSDRAEYLGNNNSDCTFRIKQLRERDSAVYRFRFLTDRQDGKYTGQPGVSLTVTGLQVKVTENEAQRVTLTCSSTCTLSGTPTITWNKNGKVVSNKHKKSINLASTDDSDLYSCATGGVTSPAVNVKCVKVEIISDTVSGGDSVELTCRETCSWRGNSFIWYKNEQRLTDYYRFSQSNIKFTAKSEDTGRYSCAVNDDQRLVSPAVTLSVRCVTVEMKSNTVSEGVRVTLTCKITCTDLTGSQTFIWYKNGQYLYHTTQKYQNHDLQFIASIGDAGSYSCAVSGHENLPSPAVTLCLKVDINSDTVSGGETVELTCTATCTYPTGSNSFIWYKNEQLLTGGNRFSQSYRILKFTARSGDTGRYSCAVRDNQHLVSPAVTLSVRCVKVEIQPSTVSEGVSVTLTCKITCTDLTGSQTFIWYKNGQSLSYTTQNYQNHDLHFKASSGHAGSYSCAVTGHENLPSPAVTLSVRCLKVDINSDTVSGGETVELTCTATCTYPTGSNSFIWYKNEQLLTGGNRFSQSHRILKFTARSGDTGRYSCAVRDNQHLVSPTVTLSVRCVKVEMKSNTVSEGVRVTLTCKITCTDLTGSQTFIWYKNGQYLSHTTQKYQNHDLQFNASSGDAGSYSCAVTGHENLPSPAVTLYPPKSTSASVSASGEIVEGSSVTLTCSSSAANPPVQRYTWYKNNRAVSSETGGPEDSYTIKNITLQDAGEYICQAENGIGTNISLPKRLDVQYPPKIVSVSVSPSGEIVEGSSVTLTCSSDANPPVQRYTWYKNNRAVSSWRGSIYTFKSITQQDAGEYYCVAGNGIGRKTSPTKHLDVKYPPKSVSVSAGKIVEGSSVTLTCSSDANPPVQNYTWFKKNDTGVWQAGSGQSLNFSNFRSWNRGQYCCEAQNRLGALNSTAILVTVQGGQSLIVAAAVGVAEILALVFLCVCLRRRKSTNETEEDRQGNKSPIDGNVSEMAMSHTGTQGHQPHP